MAAETVVPFSLHCTICYEPFDVASRVPVILPCGHTYLCEPCSKRLKTCMECRTPLYMVPPPPPKPSPTCAYSPPYRYSPRSPRSTDSSRHSSPANSPRQEPVHLPIPKNLVLISLLEAAQQTSRNELKDKDYESGDDDEHVVAGMNLLSSDYGTYVVRERKGLDVYSCLSDMKERLPLENAGESSENVARESSQVTREEPPESASPAVVSPDAFRSSSTLDEDIESVDLQDSTCINAIPSIPTLLSRPSDEITCTDEILLQPTLKEDEHAVVEEKVSLHLRPHQINCKDEIVLQDRGKKDENVKQDTAEQDGNTNEQEEKIILRLSFGQTVQLVSFVDGVATLARGRGHIAATDKQLVKVGDPLDNACKLEAMLSAVVKKQHLLREKLQDLDAVESDLNCKLKEALLEPENDPFAHAPGFEDPVSLSSPSPTPSPLNTREPTDSLDVNLSDSDLVHENSESAEFDNFVFSVTAARNEQERPQVTLENFESDKSQAAGDNYYACTGNIMQNIFPGETATVSPLYDVRRPRSSSVREGIDWSTGLSGHMGLTSSSAHRQPKRREIRMMSEHRGIANIRRIRPAATGSTPSLSNPSW